MLILHILFASGIFSCKKEEEQQRTLEQEMAELQILLANRMEEGHDIDTTRSGVYYIVRDPGEGPFPERGDMCYISFNAFLASGAFFESSVKYFQGGIWGLSYKNPDSDIIPGLEEGIGKMNKGARLEMYIPSHLAYGPEGTEGVPPYTTLVYFVKMHDLVPRTD